MILQLVYTYVLDVPTRVTILRRMQKSFQTLLQPSIPSAEEFWTQRRVFSTWKRYNRVVRPHVNSWVRRRRRTDETPLMPFL